MSTIRTVGSPALAPVLEEAGLDDEAVAAMATVTNEELDELLGPDLSDSARSALPDALAAEGLASFVPEGVALTPAAIILLLQQRLNDIDGRVDALMSDMEVTRRSADSIARRADALRAIRGAISAQTDKPGKKIKLEDIHIHWDGEEMTAAELINREGLFESVEVSGGLVGELQDARAKLAEAERKGKSPERLEELQARVDGLEAELAARGDRPLNGAEKVTGASVQQALEREVADRGQLMSSSEITNIQLQSTMSRRQQFVTLATQSMKAIHDSLSAIARNVGS